MANVSQLRPFTPTNNPTLPSNLPAIGVPNPDPVAISGINRNNSSPIGSRVTRRNCRKNNYPNAATMTETDVECIVTKGKLIEELATPEDSSPYAIIKFGPPGSGKGSVLVENEIKALGVPLENYAVFEIDSLVESVKNYRNQTLKIKNKYKYGLRKKKNMYNELLGAYDTSREPLDEIQDKVIDKAIRNKVNFIFETTGARGFSGRNPIEWLLQRLEDKNLGNKKYKVVVIYPIVKADLIKNRVEKRAENTSKRANKPFFRAVNPNSIEKSTYISQLNLSHYIVPLVYANRVHKVVIVRND